MQTVPEKLLSNNKKIVLSIFLLALAVRLLLIPPNHSKNTFTDLNIYRETGQIIKNGINPYNYSDKTDLRNKLRLDTIAFDSYVDAEQEAWDYYTSSNLPLSTLNYGLIDILTNSNPVAFRIIFSVFDAILSAIIALFLVKFWKLKHTWLSLILLAGVGALAPTLILWGSVVPEDKGLQTLFMLLAVLFAKDNKWILSSFLLGISIAYKGLGIFIAPICLFTVIGEPENILRINLLQIRKGLIYTVLSVIFAMIWFIPYMPDVFIMMQNRLSSNINVEPAHGSIWTLFFNSAPQYWSVIKNIVIIILSILWSYTFIIKKLNIHAISLFLLVLFVDIMLMQGSLDRMNIGIISSMILFCFIDLKFARILAWYTIIFGYIFHLKPIITGNVNETFDAIYTLGYLIVFSAYPLFYFAKKKDISSSLSELTHNRAGTS